LPYFLSRAGKADLGLANSDVEQTKAPLTAEIIAILDDEGLSVRAAVPYSDFSRIRNVDLDRFTIDRLMKVLNRLGRDVDMKVFVKAHGAATSLIKGI
jgi:predicted XRE-type DNA-binding protein